MGESTRTIYIAIQSRRAHRRVEEEWRCQACLVTHLAEVWREAVHRIANQEHSSTLIVH